MLKLIIEDDEGRKTVVPFVRDEITIGRQEGNTIRLTERNVSRRHARLLRQAGAIKIEDLGSSNGIRVNGDRISGQVQVGDGDLIQIGDYDLAIQREDEQARAAPATTPLQLPQPRNGGRPEREAAPTMPGLPGVPEADPDDVTDDTVPRAKAVDAGPAESEAVGAARHQSTAVIRIDQVQNNNRQVVELDSTQAPRLVITNTELAGREFLITRTETRIGRVDDNDIAIDHRSLSRTHCKLVREDNGEWRVIDMQSANGLMVNGEPYAQVTLRSGDIVELGHVKLRFIGPGDHYDAPTTAMTVDTGEFEQVTGQSSSKVPLIAIVATLLVLVLGGGGYAVLKSRTPIVAPRPTEPVVAVGDSDPKPGVEPAHPNDVPTEPEEPKKTEAAQLADAQKALDGLDFATAEERLKACQVAGQPCRGAAPMLATVTAEKDFAKALDDAQTALDRQDPAEARKALDGAKRTQFQLNRLTELEARYTKLTAKVEVKKPDPVVAVKKDPVPVPVPVPTPPNTAAREKVEKLIAEARDYRKEHSYTAAVNRLNDCLGLDPNNLVCIKLIATTYATLGTNEASQAYTDKARNYYKMYLKLAPANDPAVPAIKGILASGGE